MNVLVTGGAGYIGSTLVPLLLSGGHRVRVLDSLMFGGRSLLGVWSHPRFEFLRGDIRDSGQVDSALKDVEAVVHLAAIVGDPACGRSPELAQHVNLHASLALFDTCRRAGVSRVVFASTCSNYGKMSESDEYVDESSPLRPVSLYAETKVSIERALLDRSRFEGLVATCLRFATVFGVSPRMRFDLTVNQFTMETLTRKRLVVFGEQFWRPYIHVRDAGRAIRTVLEQNASQSANQVFNVGSTSQNYRKGALVERITALAPDTVVERVHKDEDPRDYRVSFERVRRELGFKPQVDLDQGIREVASLVRSGIIEDYDDPQYRN